ncbi:tetraacyldisaccharide 4'-kinase [Aliidiomarina halalkaliphila]|uniref:Tetraacyldisaccharide 4'-kinase n=1 Tax=Aliidiomarina halalkaliphila TaxID=2593535 RepID=A0A552X4M3_9GAMM|nr:tetraacyldisaccharide 4'-kinase [Aliidiomarina halalkaliphila]TRW49981.1 tetraacyldisaccharide 4'-kinase [Aliidiomarina halalkaliphila]
MQQRKQEKQIVRWWYQPKLVLPLWPLAPLSVLFTWVAAFRRGLYKIRLKRRTKVSLPVVVVGNVTVGGTGKTPTVMGLVRLLQGAGYRPGIVSRGYGGEGPFPQRVDKNSSPLQVGDEPKLLAELTGVPVVVAPKRVQAAQMLEASGEVDVILADDGLQHYALDRDIEIAVVDGERGLGNGWRLPVGPLRESRRRLRKTQWVIINGGQPATIAGLKLKRNEQAVPMTLTSVGWRRVSDGAEIDVPDGESVLAIAGIGNPERFFNFVMEHGIDIQETRVFSDHHAYSAQDFYDVSNEVPILMTEKDAIKCRSFARPHWYYLQVSAQFPETFKEQFLRAVQQASGRELEQQQQGVKA